MWRIECKTGNTSPSDQFQNVFKNHKIRDKIKNPNIYKHDSSLFWLGT